MEELNKILKVNILNKKYKDFELRDISFEIKSGEAVALLGANGNGKTTILKCILDNITFNGKIEIFEKNILDKDERYKENIGVVFDDFCFDENLNIIILNKVMSNIYLNWNEKTFSEYIERFNLPKKKMFVSFSRGMKIKTLLAVALSHEAKLLIMDEPTSGLDPIFRRELMLALKNYIKSQDAAVLFSTHITSDVEQLASRVIFIKSGKIAVDSQLKDLRERYDISLSLDDIMVDICGGNMVDTQC